MTRTLLATDLALVKAAPPDERARVQAILDGILPVSRRSDGLMIDSREIRSFQPPDYAAIRAPTLAVSLEDDLYGTVDGARALAGLVPGAELVIHKTTGGHVWVGREAELFDAVDPFLRRSV